MLVSSHTPGSASITTLHRWGELCPGHGTAQGQASACAITALVPLALQRWDVRARLLGICLSSSAGNCGAGMCLEPLGDLVSLANISQPPQPLSELCLGFQIRQAESMELLYMNYYYRIKIFFYFLEAFFSRGTAVCALLLSAYPKEQLPNTPKRRDTQNQFSWKKPEIIKVNI